MANIQYIMSYVYNFIHTRSITAYNIQIYICMHTENMQIYAYSQYKMINIQYYTVMGISKLPASFGILLVSPSRLWERMKKIGHGNKQAPYCF